MKSPKINWRVPLVLLSFLLLSLLLLFGNYSENLEINWFGVIYAAIGFVAVAFLNGLLIPVGGYSGVTEMFLRNWRTKILCIFMMLMMFSVLMGSFTFIFLSLQFEFKVSNGVYVVYLLLIGVVVVYYYRVRYIFQVDEYTTVLINGTLHYAGERVRLLPFFTHQVEIVPSWVSLFLPQLHLHTSDGLWEVGMWTHLEIDFEAARNAGIRSLDTNTILNGAAEKLTDLVQESVGGLTFKEWRDNFKPSPRYVQVLGVFFNWYPQRIIVGLTQGDH